MVATIDDGSNEIDRPPPPGFLEWADLPTINYDGAGVPALAAEDVHLWLVPLAGLPSRLDDESLLDGGEQERARRFRFAGDRQRFVRAHVALRLILSRYCGLQPRDLHYVVGSHGRPALAAGEHRHPDFNMSHTADWALVGVRREARIGVDIEVVKAVPEWRQIAETHFTPRETELLSAMPEADRTAAFTLCWTRKEALAKATGEGLSTGLRRFEVAVEKDVRPAVRSVDGSPRQANRWTLSSTAPAPQLFASIAVNMRCARCFMKELSPPTT